VRVGDFVVVYVYVDNTQRVCASMRTDKFIDRNPGDYREGQHVELLIVDRTDLGYRAIIEDRHYGILYANEVFRPLHPGQRVDGFIKVVREDGKIDLTLVQERHLDAAYIGDQILTQLKEEGGFLPVHDKSPAEEIYRRFGVSKKKFKMAVGVLYKQGRIAIEPDGIASRRAGEEA
jgi:uncharacterized protein